MKKIILCVNRLDKYLQCAWMGRKSQSSYKGIIADRVLGFVVQFIVLYYFWQAVYDNKTVIGSRTFSEMIMYTILSISISSLFIYPSIYFMSQDIKTGNVIYLLIKPINYQLQFIFRHFGIFVFMCTLILPIFGVFALFTSNFVMPHNLIFFIISLLLGLLTMSTFNFILGAICFWTESCDGVSFLKVVIIQLCSGALIPLDFFPNSLKRIVECLPFKGIVYTPISVFQYRYTVKEFFAQCMFQLAWIFVFTLCGRVLFNKAQKIVMINGG
ncbi:ABC-2 family transporter protein [Tissierella sp.]|uniref:ABC transporter permease n=1 Tax=Tissierella sp. TaxID=41274 RepID=UPI00303D19F5